MLDKSTFQLPFIKNEVILDVSASNIAFNIFNTLYKIDERKIWYNNGIKSGANLLIRLEHSVQELSESFL